MWELNKLYKEGREAVTFMLWNSRTVNDIKKWTEIKHKNSMKETYLYFSNSTYQDIVNTHSQAKENTGV